MTIKREVEITLDEEELQQAVLSYMNQRVDADVQPIGDVKRDCIKFVVFNDGTPRVNAKVIFNEDISV